MDIKDVTNFIKSEKIDLSEHFDGEEVFVKLREPTTKEFSALTEGVNETNGGDTVYVNNFLKLLPALIVDHNFTKNGDSSKKAAAADVAAALVKKLDVTTKLSEVFQDLIPLEKASPKK